LAPGWELFGKPSEMFDRKCGSTGALGGNDFGPSGGLRALENWRNEPFVGPGAPRALRLGPRWTLGEC
jgi:hypothetical protein